MHEKGCKSWEILTNQEEKDSCIALASDKTQSSETDVEQALSVTFQFSLVGSNSWNNPFWNRVAEGAA